ncbi:unnamed protein product [Sphagnum tenellum]
MRVQKGTPYTVHLSFQFPKVPTLFMHLMWRERSGVWTSGVLQIKQKMRNIVATGRCSSGLGVFGIDAMIWRQSRQHTLQQPSPCKNVREWRRNKFTKEGKAK